MLLSLINFVQHVNKSGEGHQQACPSCVLYPLHSSFVGRVP